MSHYFLIALNREGTAWEQALLVSLQELAPAVVDSSDPEVAVQLASKTKPMNP